MKNTKNGYRMTSDVEPEEKALAALMHEVAIEASIKAKKAKLELEKKIKLLISDALLEAGYKDK